MRDLKCRIAAEARSFLEDVGCQGIRMQISTANKDYYLLAAAQKYMEASAFILLILSDSMGKRQVCRHPIAAGRLLALLQG